MKLNMKVNFLNLIISVLLIVLMWQLITKSYLTGFMNLLFNSGQTQKTWSLILFALWLLPKWFGLGQFNVLSDMQRKSDGEDINVRRSGLMIADLMPVYRNFKCCDMIIASPALKILMYILTFLAPVLGITAYILSANLFTGTMILYGQVTWLVCICLYYIGSVLLVGIRLFAYNFLLALTAIFPPFGWIVLSIVQRKDIYNQNYFS